MCCSSSTTRTRLMTSASGAARAVNVAPRPSPSLCANTRPPCARAIARDDVQPEARALDLPEPARLHAVEAVEDSLELLARDADAAILHADPDRVGRGRRHRHRDADVAARNT